MDLRWILIVLGIAFIVAAILLLATAAIVSGAVSAGAMGCRSSSCPNTDPGPWLDDIGVPFLVLGSLLLIVGLWRAFR